MLERDSGTNTCSTRPLTSLPGQAIPSATRLLLVLDGSGAQHVIRSTDTREITRIARDYARLEFHLAQ
jgi:hypothetical protein